ncbi:MAG: exosortase A [Gammaproteobacteria bacterium]|nr:exosortase A [Gammaproteobacteria bacterium]
MPADTTKALNWAPGWYPTVLIFGVSLLVLGAVFWPVYRDIVVIWWRAETYAHGFLILPIVGYLLWLKRADLAPLAPRPAPLAALLMVLPALLWLLANAAQVAAAEQLAVVLMIPILVWVVFGTAVLRRILFPLAYLLFAVPLGDFLVGPLQDVTAVFTVWALQLTGIPVYLEGRFFYIPTGAFEVAEACSGIRYLIASLALGTLYAYLNYVSLQRRLIFVALAIIVPIIANGLRAYGIVMLAHLSDYTIAVGVDHLIYGWLFFGVVIMLLFWVGSFFREDLAPQPDHAEINTQATTAVQAHEVKRLALWAALTLSIAASAPGFAAWMDARSAAAPLSAVTLPQGTGEWAGPFATSSPWRPHFVGAQEQRVEYRKQGQRVEVYLAYYPSQDKEAELINWHNAVFDSERSQRLAGAAAQARLPNAASWPVFETRLLTGDDSRLVWHWYEIDGAATVSRVWAKAYAARSRLLGSRTGSVAWVLSTEYSLGAEQGAAVMEDFLGSMLPQLREAVQQ